MVGGQRGEMTAHSVVSVARSFDGDALLRVRATTAHDSYERLVSCACSVRIIGRDVIGAEGLVPLDKLIRDVATVGIDTEKVRAAGGRDDAIAEFSRFYLERGRVEMESAGADERKRRKLEDDFTPRIDMTLVGLEGVTTGYKSSGTIYISVGRSITNLIWLFVLPCREVVGAPATDRCAEFEPDCAKVLFEAAAKRRVPRSLNTYWPTSDISGRKALPKFMAKCAFSGKLALLDELEKSHVTGRLVASAFARPRS